MLLGTRRLSKERNYQVLKTKLGHAEARTRDLLVWGVVRMGSQTVPKLNLQLKTHGKLTIVVQPQRVSTRVKINATPPKFSHCGSTMTYTK